MYSDAQFIPHIPINRSDTETVGDGRGEVRSGMRRRREEEERDERGMFYPRWLSICPRDRVRDQVLFRLEGG